MSERDGIDLDNGLRSYPWTYTNQPGNGGAWVLGECAMRAKPGGDPIDHGLSLLHELHARGFGIVRVPRLPASERAAATGPGLGAFAGMTSQQVRQIILNADRIARRRRDPAWVFVGNLFGVGSTVAMNLCYHAGIDPDLKVSAARQGVPSGSR